MSEMQHNGVFKQSGLWQKIGVPKQLVWGYVGLFLFVTGATLEQSWLSSLLTHSGFDEFQVSFAAMMFGLCVALASWFSGIGTQVWGQRCLMWAAVVVFFASSLPLIFLALPARSYPGIVLTYMLRGIAYPLFAYSFLVWINMRTEKEILGRAVSWFWNAFALGMVILGPWYSGALIPLMGENAVLCSGFIFVAAGAFFSLIVTRDKPAIVRGRAGAEFLNGIVIMFREPKLSLAVVVKTINDIGKFSFVILMPLYLPRFGFSLSEWLAIWGSVNIINLFSNAFFGYVGDKIGWQKTVVLFAGTLCGTSALLVCYAPVIFGHSQMALFLALAVYAIGLGAFGPLSALIPSLSPDNKGAAISCLNLGSGMSNFVGPLIVSLCILPLGIEGTLGVIAGLYFLASLMAVGLREAV